jgi:hypothetical protein
VRVFVPLGAKFRRNDFSKPSLAKNEIPQNLSENFSSVQSRRARKHFSDETKTRTLHKEREGCGTHTARLPAKSLQILNVRGRLAKADGSHP